MAIEMRVARSGGLGKTPNLGIHLKDALHDLALLPSLLGCQARSMRSNTQLLNQFAALSLAIKHSAPVGHSGTGQHLSRGQFNGPVVID